MDSQQQGLSIEDRLSVIEQELDWQKHIHRNVTEDGNITHTWNILPVVAVACLLGVIAGIVIVKHFR